MRARTSPPDPLSGAERGTGGRASPRIGLSRAVYPADDRQTAVKHLEHGVAEYVDQMIARGNFTRGLSQEAYFRRSHIHYGHPEEVVASLESDRLLPMTTELICQVQPGEPTADQIMKSLELIATEVAPALGWQPTIAPASPLPRKGEGAGEGASPIAAHPTEGAA